MQPAIFLDRDGVIIENCPDYVRSWEDVQIFNQALSALANIKMSPYHIIIVTNQSAIGRGIITLKQAHSINTRLVTTIVQAGGRIDKVLMCPHKPDDNCNCRKPKPGLLLQAAKEMSIDLEHSIMIGDAYSDLIAGHLAGIQNVVLVRTGRGLVQERQSIPAELLGKYSIYDNLAEALKNFL